jgi:hypothetical protein
MKDRQRAPILIIGAHRSGTTATARALELLGLQIGQRLDSHREPRALQKVHEEYLRRHGAAWHNPEPFLRWIEIAEGKRDCVEYLRQNVRRNFAQLFGYRRGPRGFRLRMRLKWGVAWGWKEPRTTLFAPAWLEIFPQARVIHVLRDPRAAAASIRERELKFQATGDPPARSLDDFEYCLRLVQIYVEAGERLAAGASYRRVRFEEIQADPAGTLAELGRFCGLQFTPRQVASATATIRPAGS